MRQVPLILLAILIATLSACDEGGTVDPPDPVKGKISGTVWHRLHPEEPLEGVAVSWGVAEDFTDSEGAYQLADLEAGADSLRLSLLGYRSEAEWIEVDGDSVAEGFTLMPLDTIPPLAPLSFVSETEDGAYIILSWTAPEDETRTGFALAKTPGDPHFQVLTAATESYRDVQVAPLRDYHYSLYCRDAYGNLSDPLELNVEVDTYPSPPIFEVLEGSDFASIPLAWSENIDPDFSHYRLYRAGANADSTDLLVYEGTAIEFTDEDVEANAVYSYRVYTYDVTGNASSTFYSEGDAAAQVYLPGFGETSVIHALADGERFLAIGRGSGTIRVCDFEANLLESLTPSSGVTQWIFIEDDLILGFGTELWTYSQVSLDPLEETAGGAHLLGDLNSMAWLGDDRVIVTGWDAQAPRLVDSHSFTVIDTLHLLDDTGDRAMVTADIGLSRVFVADSPDEGRLRLVHLGDPEPLLLAETVLPGRPFAMRLNADGNLLLAFLAPGRVELRDSEDLALLDFIELGISPERVFFTPNETEIWGADFETRSVFGMRLFGGESVANLHVIELPLDVQILESADRVVVGQTSNKISLLLLDPEDD